MNSLTVASLAYMKELSVRRRAREICVKGGGVFKKVEKKEGEE